MKHDLEIPIPPSTNNLYGNRSGKGGRGKTDRYRAWLKESLWVIKSGFPVLEPPVKIGITVYAGKGFSTASDISNRMKAAEDALVSTGRIPGDSVRHVTETRQRYISEGDGTARCVLSVVDSSATEEILEAIGVL